MSRHVEHDKMGLFECIRHLGSDLNLFYQINLSTLVSYNFLECPAWTLCTTMKHGHEKACKSNSSSLKIRAELQTVVVEIEI